MSSQVETYYGDQSSSVVVVVVPTAAATTQPSTDQAGRKVENWTDHFCDWVYEHDKLVTGLLVAGIIVSLCLIGGGIGMCQTASSEFTPLWEAGFGCGVGGAVGALMFAIAVGEQGEYVRWRNGANE